MHDCMYRKKQENQLKMLPFPQVQHYLSEFEFSLLSCSLLLFKQNLDFKPSTNLMNQHNSFIISVCSGCVCRIFISSGDFGTKDWTKIMVDNNKQIIYMVKPNSGTYKLKQMMIIWIDRCGIIYYIHVLCQNIIANLNPIAIYNYNGSFKMI